MKWIKLIFGIQSPTLNLWINIKKPKNLYEKLYIKRCLKK